MAYNREKYAGTRQYVAEAREKLLNKELLSERECLRLSKEIEKLPDIEILPIEEDITLNIDELFNEFREYAGRSKNKLEGILAIISEGRIPNSEERKEFDEIIDALCERYNLVCMVAKKELLDEEMPSEGSSINDFYNAIKTSKSAIRKSQINGLKEILQRFISVQSLVANLTSALEPFQKDAKSLLERINNGEVNTIDEITEEVAGPQLFMRALECDDLNTDEGNDMLDCLEENFSYPSRVTRGLTSKSYFIPEGVASTASADFENGNDLCHKSKTLKELQQIKNVELTNIPEIKEEVKHEKVEEESDNKLENKEKQKSAFSIAVEEAGVALQEKEFGILSSEISSSETKKLSASVFTNDLRKGNVKALKNIIQQIDKFPMLSAELLRIRYKMSENIAEGSLGFLLKKGYLRKYKVMPGGDFYCSSPRLEKALTYKEASRFVGVRQYHADQLDELIEDKAPSASARKAFLNLYINSTLNYRKTGVTQNLSSNMLMTEAFLFRSCDSAVPENCEVFAGVFWSNYTECDDFIKNFEEFISESEVVIRFVLAAFNKTTAITISKEIKRCNFKKLKEVSMILYAFDEDKCYSEDEEELVVGDIWPALSEGPGSDNDEKDNELEKEEFTELSADDIIVKNSEGSNQKLKTEEKIFVKQNAELPDANTRPIVDDSQSSDEIIYKFFIGRKYYCAPAYVKALLMRDESYSDLYDRIAYAVNDPMKHCTYSADSVFDMVPVNHDYFSDSLMVAVGLRTFFSNQVRYDYNIKAFYSAVKEYSVLNEYPSLSNVLYKLVEFKDEQKKGMDLYADYHAKSVAQLDDELRKIQQEAKLFYDSVIIGKKSEKASQRRFLETKKMLLDARGDIGQYIKAIADNDRDVQPLLVDFLQSKFIKEGNTLSEDNIDADMLWNFIMVFWNQAGEKMMVYRRADLMSHLRSNIVNVTSKALQIMIRWCNLVEKTNDQTEDSSSIAYKKIRKPLLDDIKEALSAIEMDLNSDGLNNDEKAGLEVIRYTLDEIMRCIEGTYEEHEKRFFYAPFLFTDDVLLDENFCPDLEVRSAEVKELLPEYRILEHTKKFRVEPIERLKEILDDGGDDYGIARLIVEYLRVTAPNINVDILTKNIDDGEAYAKETADLKKSQFIGDLELAQSYGQIDNSNSSEDKKEKILQIVDVWYEWACDSSNYGFFGRVMESYLEEIRREAKTREKDLITQFDAFRGASINGLSTETKEKKIAKIQAALNQQNYTVVEDLLAHASQPDDDYEDIIEENFLKDFLDDFNDYYKIVAMSKTSFANLVSGRTRNKEERGGKRLADNWLPGGSNLGKNRLVALLSGFGFRVDENSVQLQNPIGKFENFIVRTIAAKDGKRENYTHPIAAFGSGASQEGFRVVCLNGKYDAAGLIDVMKQIGNAKHTMILLDCALDKPERRILARKSKSELGDKLFVVVDRTVMMYMVKNYDETKANRMLMSLITPFGYYQPYVWESSNVMPPEIFMGRKHELERIESPNGANIVYGGRQLGKSALLKKAKADIDGDENGDRAVLVEIKGLDYKSAAKKIAHALYDEGVLTEDIDTTDWDDLSRVIRRRLQLEKNRIQYLLLLLDEADAFIESCEEVNYRPFDALKEIQNIGSGRFKFVIAGLRNIVRFKRDVALGNNSVLTHLEAMTVKPFQPAEARELMEIPLHYLGLEFPKENESLITLILATTNYFPGLIQMYCAKLLSAMRSKDYAGYDEADTPIYEISEEHIKKVLADPEFMDQIREKFIITLKLDEDNYYYLIALIMAYLYHNNGYNEGYSVADIKEAGKDIGIAKIAKLDNDKLFAFMEELKELNVLRSTDDNHYLFTRFSFFQMMGTSSEVDNKLVEYMED